LNSLPFALGTVALFIWSWHSDRHNERRLHTAVPLLIGFLALAGTLVVDTLPLTILVLCVAVSAASMIKGPFWALATEIVPNAASAVAFGQITALTNVGAFIGTWGIGAIRQSTGSFALAMLPLMGLMLLAFVFALLVGRKHTSLQGSLAAAPAMARTE
jgi:nitrate/nitrite transporter NarK